MEMDKKKRGGPTQNLWKKRSFKEWATKTKSKKKKKKRQPEVPRTEQKRRSYLQEVLICYCWQDKLEKSQALFGLRSKGGLCPHEGHFGWRVSQGTGCSTRLVTPCWCSENTVVIWKFYCWFLMHLNSLHTDIEHAVSMGKQPRTLVKETDMTFILA